MSKSTFYAFSDSGELIITKADTLPGAKKKAREVGFNPADFQWWELCDEPGIVAMEPRTKGYRWVKPHE